MLKGFTKFEKSFDIIFSQDSRDMIGGTLNVWKRNVSKGKGRRVSIF
jgi:hypothetical protein